MKVAIICLLAMTITVDAVSAFGDEMQKKGGQSKQVEPASGVPIGIMKGLQFLAHTDKENFRPGEVITLKLSVKNNTQRALYLPDTYHPEWDYTFEVKNERGETVSLTADGERLMRNVAVFRQVQIEIKPGAEVRHDFQLNKLFNLAASGLYTITVRHQVWEPSHKAFTTVKSNTVRIRIRG